MFFAGAAIVSMNAMAPDDANAEQLPPAPTPIECPQSGCVTPGTPVSPPNGCNDLSGCDPTLPEPPGPVDPTLPPGTPGGGDGGDANADANADARARAEADARARAQANAEGGDATATSSSGGNVLSTNNRWEAAANTASAIATGNPGECSRGGIALQAGTVGATGGIGLNFGTNKDCVAEGRASRERIALGVAERAAQADERIAGMNSQYCTVAVGTSVQTNGLLEGDDPLFSRDEYRGECISTYTAPAAPRSLPVAPVSEYRTGELSLVQQCAAAEGNVVVLENKEYVMTGAVAPRVLPANGENFGGCLGLKQPG